MAAAIAAGGLAVTAPSAGASTAGGSVGTTSVGGTLMALGGRVWSDDTNVYAEWADGGARNNGERDPEDDANPATPGIDGPGLNGVAVELWRDADGSGTLDRAVDSYVTIYTIPSGGYYLFDDVPEGDYFVYLSASEFGPAASLTGLVSSFDRNGAPTPSDGVDDVDDGVDAASPATTGVASGLITLRAGAAPTGETDIGPSGAGSGKADEDSDLTVDFGFTRPPMSVGNRVWLDDGSVQVERNNAVRNADEPGIAGVRINLFIFLGSVNGTDTGLQATTDANGYFLFDNLPPGTYSLDILPVRPPLNPADPAVSPVLENTVSSSNAAPNPVIFDNGIDDNDNGRDDLQFRIASSVILSPGTERTGEADLPAGYGPAHRGDNGERDADSDLTIDFGVFSPMALGNRVWIDDTADPLAEAADDGVLDGADDLDNPNTTGEVAPGVQGATVRLYRDLDGDGAVDSGEDTGRTVTTDASGYYQFNRLPRGKYLVAVEASNFASGRPLAGFRSSTDPSAAADDDTDSVDDGVGGGAVGADGVLSPSIELSYTTRTDGDEPTSGTEVDPVVQTPVSYPTAVQRDDFSNLTVDFGFVRSATTPVADEDAYETDFETELTVPAPGVLDGDQDRDPGSSLTAAIDTEPANGTVSLASDGSFTYTPDDGFIGEDSFTYTAEDGALSSAPATVRVSVGDRAPVPTMTPGAASIVEGDSGTTFVEVPVTLSKPWSQPVSASWSTRFITTPVPPGQASPSADYVAGSGIVTFAPGETEATIAIEVIGDTRIDPDEWIPVFLKDPVNAELGGFFGVGFGGIFDDDTPATIIPGRAVVAENDSDLTLIQIPVTLDAPSRKVVSASWTADFVPGAPPNQATPTTDFLQAAGSVTFQPGETLAYIDMYVVGDTEVEPDEYFVVFVDNPVNGRMGGFYGLGLGGILDDDGTSPPL